MTRRAGIPGFADAPAGHYPPPAQVVRRTLLRHGIAVDVETAQLVAEAVRAVLQAGMPSRPPRRRPRVPADCEPLF